MDPTSKVIENLKQAEARMDSARARCGWSQSPAGKSNHGRAIDDGMDGESEGEVPDHRGTALGDASGRREVDETSDDETSDDEEQQVEDEHDGFGDDETGYVDTEHDEQEKTSLSGEVLYLGNKGYFHLLDYLGEEWCDLIREIHRVKPYPQPSPNYMSRQLWDSQLIGIAKTRHVLLHGKLDAVVLGDAFGHGKTITAIEAIRSLKNLPGAFVLVVTTKTSVGQWIKELEAYTTEHRPSYYQFGQRRKLTTRELISGQYEFVFCTYEWLSQHHKTVNAGKAGSRDRGLFSEVLGDNETESIRVLVLDEAQKAMNVQSECHKSIKALHYNKLVLITGEFIANKWWETFGLLRLMPREHPFRHQRQFDATFRPEKQTHGVWADRYDMRKLHQDRFTLFMMPNIVARPENLDRLGPCERADLMFELGPFDEIVVMGLFCRSRKAIQSGLGGAADEAACETEGTDRAGDGGDGFYLCAREYAGHPDQSQQQVPSAIFEDAEAFSSGDQQIQYILDRLKLSRQEREEVCQLTGKTDQMRTLARIICSSSSAQEVAWDEAHSIGRADQPVLPNRGDNDTEDKHCAATVGDPTNSVVHSARTSAITCKIVEHFKAAEKESRSCRIVVFSQFLRFLMILQQAIAQDPDLNRDRQVELFLLHGSLSGQCRIKLIDTFSSSPVGFGILLVTQGAGGISANMQAADVVIIAEEWWSQNDVEQAIKRVHRGNKQERVDVFQVMATNSIVDWVIRTQRIEKARLTELLRGRLQRPDSAELDIPSLPQHVRMSRRYEISGQEMEDGSGDDGSDEHADANEALLVDALGDRQCDQNNWHGFYERWGHSDFPDDSEELTRSVAGEPNGLFCYIPVGSDEDVPESEVASVGLKVQWGGKWYRQVGGQLSVSTHGHTWKTAKKLKPGDQKAIMDLISRRVTEMENSEDEAAETELSTGELSRIKENLKRKRV